MSQWQGTSLATDCRNEASSSACYARHPSNDYQIPQFWYNALSWVSSDRECFDIDDVSIVK